MSIADREKRAILVFRNVGVRQHDAERYIRNQGLEEAMRFELGLHLTTREWEKALARHGGDALVAMEELFPTPAKGSQ